MSMYEPGRHKKDSKKYCRYNQNKGYVVFSAMGSFFIPLTVMLYVYLKIGYVLTSRRQRIVRDAFLFIECTLRGMMYKKKKKTKM
uniref:G-protein coupled receptors family 1 profile domain-containing protein n=1 Tax=Glossina pallidipes TaxID=7398 RepID=A0A1B0A8M9_GLOPL